MCIRTAISERYHGDGEDIDWITIPKRPPNVMLQARHCWDVEHEAAASCVSLVGEDGDGRGLGRFSSHARAHIPANRSACSASARHKAPHEEDRPSLPLMYTHNAHPAGRRHRGDKTDARSPPGPRPRSTSPPAPHPASLPPTPPDAAPEPLALKRVTTTKREAVSAAAASAGSNTRPPPPASEIDIVRTSTHRNMVSLRICGKGLAIIEEEVEKGEVRARGGRRETMGNEGGREREEEDERGRRGGQRGGTRGRREGEAGR
ncbi:hypothetical protein B0H11DRAFT_2184410 [Mycena galericulata]|nr:hypothetical protein B0H11DRAFT_2184410 [Mycena galericulata]